MSVMRNESALLHLPRDIWYLVLRYLPMDDIHNIGKLSPSCLAASKSLILELHSQGRYCNSSVNEDGLEILEAFCRPDFQRSQIHDLAIVGDESGKLPPVRWRIVVSGLVNLRSFETSHACVLPYLHLKNKIIHLSVPAYAYLNVGRFRSLESLTIHHAYKHTKKLRTIHKHPELRSLSVELAVRHCFADKSLIDLDSLPSLEELYLITPNLWPQTSHICTGFSTSLSRLVMIGAFTFSGLRQFTNMLHRLSSLTIESLSFKGLSMHYRATADTWAWMPALRSLELIDTDPKLFSNMVWCGLRKVLIETADLVPMKVIVRVLTRARSLLSFSIVIRVRSKSWENICLMYSSECVEALATNKHLRQFQSIGPYAFHPNDWKKLCGLQQLDLLHAISCEVPDYPSIESVAALKRQFLAQADADEDFKISQNLVPRRLVFDCASDSIRRRQL